jgi:hypothetical protein
VIIRVPDLEPVAVGSKKTPIEQLAPAATLLPQLLSTPKSATEVFTPPIVKVALPVFASVTVTGRPEVFTYWLGKEMDGGDRLTTGADGVLPLSGMVCEPPGTLPKILIAAWNVAAEGGVKMTLIWQLPPAATEPPQLFVWAKALLPVPVMANEEMASAPLPLF